MKKSGKIREMKDLKKTDIVNVMKVWYVNEVLIPEGAHRGLCSCLYLCVTLHNQLKCYPELIDVANFTQKPVPCCS